MKYNIPFGIAGEICKFLSYNDIVEALTAKLFENGIDVIHHKKRSKARLLAKMAVNSSFNYYKNKNLTVVQITLLFIKHLKILKTYMRYKEPELWPRFIKPDIDRVIERYNNDLEHYKNKSDVYSRYHYSPPWMLTLRENGCFFHEVVKKSVIHCPCSVDKTIKDCYCESIFIKVYITHHGCITKLHTDIRDLKSFISPKKLKLLELIN